jgi:hypothetical protein
MQLIYRAQIFEYTPRPPMQSSRKPCALNHTVKDGAVKLIYRAQAFEYTPPPIQPYRKPRAINWRFQMAMEGKRQPNRPPA